MPTYQYRCKECGVEFEEFQSIVEDPITVCPECDGKVHRIISGGAGLIFKGSGFYQTDYNRTQYNKDKSSEKASVTESSSSKKDSASKTPGSDTKKSSTQKSDS